MQAELEQFFVGWQRTWVKIENGILADLQELEGQIGLTNSAALRRLAPKGPVILKRMRIQVDITQHLTNDLLESRGRSPREQ